MRKVAIKYSIYINLERLKKQGYKKISIRDLINDLDINKSNYDLIFRIAYIAEEMGYGVIINGKN